MSGKRPDFLTECSTSAIRMGISYGQYMARRYEAGLRVAAAEKSAPDAVCKSCGKPFVKSARYRVYCSEACKCNGELQIKRRKYNENSQNRG